MILFFFSVRPFLYFQSLHQEKAVPVIESSDVDMTLDVSPDRVLRWNLCYDAVTKAAKL